MDKIERVRAALAGQEVDRVPAGFWFHFPPAQAHGEESVKAHLDYYRRSNVDFLKIMNEHPYQSNIPIKVPADWRRLRAAPLRSPFYQQQLDEVKRIVDQIAGDCLVIATVFGPFASGNYASGERLTWHLKLDAKSVNHGLAAIAHSLAEFAIACVEAGATGIYYAAQGGEAGRFTAEEFLHYIKPHDLTVLSAVQRVGEFHLLHICGEQIRLPLYADYPAQAVNWAVTRGKGNLNLRQGSAVFRRTVVGGLDNNGVLATGTAQQIRSAVREVIQDFGRRSLILGADCTVPTDIPIENIRIAVEATMM